jgi:hypothetical protein
MITKEAFDIFQRRYNGLLRGDHSTAVAARMRMSDNPNTASKVSFCLIIRKECCLNQKRKLNAITPYTGILF